MTGMASGSRMCTHVDIGTGNAPKVLLISMAVRPITTRRAFFPMPQWMNSMSIRW